MPVSKKRKKDGKPVQMTHAPSVQGEEHAHGPDAKPEASTPRRAGKPSNPFVAQQSRRASQRGR